LKLSFILESVDSICRDSADMQHVTILVNGKLISLYSNLPFIFEHFHDRQDPGCTEKLYKSTKPESSKMAKLFFFFISYRAEHDLIVFLQL